MSEASKRVLCLAYEFTPLANGGVVRIHSFVKYLPALGYLPVVLTVDPAWYETDSLDESLLSHYSPEVEIVHTRSLMVQGRVIQSARVHVMGYNRPRPPFAEQIRWLLKAVYHSLSVPDHTAFWLPIALQAGLRLIRKHRPMAIFATTPPHGVGLIGALLSRLTRTPLILDVRDNWRGNLAYEPKNRFRGWLEEQFERFVIATAQSVLVVTEESRSLLDQRYPYKSPGFFSLIPNGFDPDAWASTGVPDSNNEVPPKKVGRLRMVYGGGLMGERTPEIFFRAIQALLQADADLPSKLEVIFIGQMRPEYQGLIESYGLANVVSYRGFWKQTDFRNLLMTADVGLIMSPPGEGAATAIPGKVYEYMAAGLYLFVLAEPHAATAKFVTENKLGRTAPWQDDVAIAATLRELIECAAAGTLRQVVPIEVLNRFNRREHARQLAKIFSRCLSN